MCDRRLQRTRRTLPALHRPQETSQAATYLHGTELGWILQDRSCRLDPNIGALHRFPQVRCLSQGFVQQSVQTTKLSG
jgi:hypothetical protein